MIGGIIRSVHSSYGKTALLVEEDADFGITEYLVVNLKTDLKIFNVGDDIWWQGDYAYFSKKDNSIQNFRIERLGFAYEWYRGIEPDDK